MDGGHPTGQMDEQQNRSFEPMWSGSAVGSDGCSLTQPVLFSQLFYAICVLLCVVLFVGFSKDITEDRQLDLDYVLSIYWIYRIIFKEKLTPVSDPIPIPRVSFGPSSTHDCGVHGNRSSVRP